jgi:hypothetical protein
MTHIRSTGARQDRAFEWLGEVRIDIAADAGAVNTASGSDSPANSAAFPCFAPATSEKFRCLSARQIHVK